MSNNINRRTALMGAVASCAALAVPAGKALAGKSAPAGVTLAETAAAAPTALADAESITFEIVGRYFCMSPGQRAETRRQMAEAGNDYLAEALRLAVPDVRPRPRTLQELIDQAGDDAQRIDPTIKAVWVVTDETRDGPREDRLCGLTFERPVGNGRRAKR